MMTIVKMDIQKLTDQQVKDLYFETMEDTKIQLDLLSQCTDKAGRFIDAPNLCFAESHKHYRLVSKRLHDIIVELKRRKIVQYPEQVSIKKIKKQRN